MLAAAPLLIVAHGAPSCPPSQEFWLHDLAARVSAAGARGAVGTTLAARAPFAGAVARAAAAAAGGMVRIYPMFMTDGWFTRSELPRRLAAAGLPPERQAILPPFGLDPALPALCAARVSAAARDAGIDPAAATLVVAAHGSPRSPRPAEVTARVGAEAARLSGFAHLRCGYVDQAPGLEEALSAPGPAVCLPFFATAASHVQMDLPEALSAAGFRGPVAPPVGLFGDVPGMIAAAAKRDSLGA